MLGAVAVSAVAGCSTPYQQHGFTGGYTDHKIDDQTYTVQFSGNGHTSKDKVHKFFMYRCAELTKQAGYQYFTIVPTGTLSDAGNAVTLVRGSGFDHSMMRKAHYVAPVVIYSGGVGVANRYMDNATIRMFNDDAVFPARVVGWDVAEILDNLGPYVRTDGQSNANLPRAWVFEPGKPKTRIEDLLPTTPKKPDAASS
ncbi:CC0125/CC1285 family lipoprotein [Pararobbsia alpina]|uniref:CC0125/CC1285 family lipoprotein n=1 Tax=Pararobbsia alpina TaxID=621374 RepID=UPI0039A5A547